MKTLRMQISRGHNSQVKPLTLEAREPGRPYESSPGPHHRRLVRGSVAAKETLTGRVTWSTTTNGKEQIRVLICICNPELSVRGDDFEFDDTIGPHSHGVGQGADATTLRNIASDKWLVVLMLATHHEVSTTGTNARAGTSEEGEVVRMGKFVDLIKDNTSTNGHGGCDRGAMGRAGLDECRLIDNL